MRKHKSLFFLYVGIHLNIYMSTNLIKLDLVFIATWSYGKGLKDKTAAEKTKKDYYDKMNCQ